MVFRFFRTLTRKTCFFAGKILAMLSKLFLTCPEEHLQSNLSEGKSLNLEEFWINFEVSGTTAENLFQGWQNSNGCPGNSLGKKLFKRENFAIFPILSHFLTSSERVRQICKTRNPRIRGSFWGKTFFEMFNFSHFFGLWSKRPFFGNSFPGGNNCNSRVESHSLRKSIFLKKNYICSSVLEFEQLCCLLIKKSQGVKETT